MPFSWNNYPYTNFHELNIDWFLKKFKEIFDEWANLYSSMLDWKQATDEEIQTILDRTEILINTYEEWVETTQNNSSDIETLKRKVETLEYNTLQLTNNKVEKPQTPYNPNGENGQTLISLGNGKTKWAYIETDPGLIEIAVNNWLDNHPEATTTVQDNAITFSKLNSSLTQKSAYFYNTYEDMLEDITTNNCLCITLGYNEAKDGGDNIYIKENNVLTSATNKNVKEYYYTINNKAVIYKAGDIGTIVNDILIVENNVNEIDILNRTFTLENNITLPQNYKVNIDKETIINADNASIYMDSYDEIRGGIFNILSNTPLFVINAYEGGKGFIKINNVTVNGTRDGINTVDNQKAVYVDCDGTNSEPSIGLGSFYNSTFNMNIYDCGYAYHFKRMISSGTATSGRTEGVWVKNNKIYGYISHCYYFICNDFNSTLYPNDNLEIYCDMQGNGLKENEIAVKGRGIKANGKHLTVFGNMFDFSSANLGGEKAIYFYATADGCYIESQASIEYTGGITGGITNLDIASKWAGYHKLTKANNLIETNTNVGDISLGASYVSGNIVHINIQFKVFQDSGDIVYNGVAKGDTIFNLKFGTSSKTGYNKLIVTKAGSGANSPFISVCDYSNSTVDGVQTIAIKAMDTFVKSSLIYNLQGDIILNTLDSDAF